MKAEKSDIKYFRGSYHNRVIHDSHLHYYDLHYILIKNTKRSISGRGCVYNSYTMYSDRPC